MENALELVKSFNASAGQPSVDAEDQVSKSVAELRARLILEELGELMEASGHFDVFENVLANALRKTRSHIKKEGIQTTHQPHLVLDGMGDLLVVVLGMAVSLGLDKHLPVAFERIMEANMSKFELTLEEASELLAEKTKKNPKESYSLRKTGHVSGDYYVVVDSGDKVVKSESFKQPDLSDLVSVVEVVTHRPYEPKRKGVGRPRKSDSAKSNSASTNISHSDNVGMEPATEPEPATI